jgi:antitoxin ParD1/3/4
MTVKSSISLRDEHYAFAAALVKTGRFASISAVVQQGLDLLRRREDDARLDRDALRALLQERASGPLVSADDLRGALKARRG